MLMPVFVLGLAAAARADSPAQYTHHFGLGAQFGSPTGLSGKYWINDRLAVDGLMGWNFHDADRFQIHTDALWHFDGTHLDFTDARIPLYAGVGARYIPGGPSQAGIRFPLGITCLPKEMPTEFFAEVVPVAQFAPYGAIRLDGGFGVRYYFQ